MSGIDEAGPVELAELEEGWAGGASPEAALTAAGEVVERVRRVVADVAAVLAAHAAVVLPAARPGGVGTAAVRAREAGDRLAEARALIEAARTATTTTTSTTTMRDELEG